jgi:uncharacterized repeat protein (TIGR03806 family)
MSISRFGLFLLSVIGFCWLLGSSPREPLHAEEKKVDPKTHLFECRWTETPIKIDGVADEAAWNEAERIDYFYLPWLGEKARPAKTKTRARLLWDREYVYFLAELEDFDLFADVKEHNGQTWDNDVFELFFYPSEKNEAYYEFQVNALGTYFDRYLSDRKTVRKERSPDEPEFHLEAKVKLDGTLNQRNDKDKGWLVEGRIPWRDFLKTGGRPLPEEKWKFNLSRYDYTLNQEPELSTCAPLTKVNYHQLEDYATLVFKGPPAKQKFGIEKRVPLTTSTVKGSPEPPLPYIVQKAFPDAKMNYPIHVVRQPGTELLLLISADGSYAPTKILRMKDDPRATEFEEIWKMKGIAYDLIFHPKFQENGYVYLGWNTGREKGGMATRVTRYTMAREAPYALDLKSEKLIIEWESDGHNGGAITFGNDGMLYITSGDGTSDSDRNVMGQEMSQLLSKVLRIDVDHPAEGRAYSVPKDNPFVGKEGIAPETWAFGLRNPWRMTCDPKTGHIWVGNNGQDIWEQIFFVRKGDNFGWSVYEGSHPFYLNRKLGPAPHTKPALEHHHSEARSLTGGVVYHGTQFPELSGAYIYGDYSTGRIWAAKHDGQKVLWHKAIAQTRLQITGFGIDSKGELLICDHQGGGKGNLYRLVSNPKKTPDEKFPRKLSDSGLFASVKDHAMVPAMIPYSVNAPFWSDGAFKVRYLGLTDPNAKIDLSNNRGWNLPDETVIVKSFALEMEEGNPKSRKWIETRFMTRQEGEWFGYSYLWNDEQTDATLIDSPGMDRDYTIQTPQGEKKQKWHYPSRAECMICHSRAANWVLGLCTGQMNKVHDYNGTPDHQFRVLEHLGLLNSFNFVEDQKKRIREELEEAGKKKDEIDAYLRRQTGPAGPSSSMLSFNFDQYRKLVDPFDAKQNLTQRAKSWLHTNCASCHVEAGGGNALMELEFQTRLDKMRILEVKPVHSTFNLPEARLIAPGHPERSVLLHRMSHRQEGHMPPLSTFVVDQRGVELIREWIQSLK